MRQCRACSKHQANVAANITNNAISHNDNPRTEQCKERAPTTNQAPVVFPPLPTTGIEMSSWLNAHVTAAFGCRAQDLASVGLELKAAPSLHSCFPCSLSQNLPPETRH